MAMTKPHAAGAPALRLLRRDRAMTAVAIMLDVAFHSGRTATVSAAEIAERIGLARRGLEPLLQALSRADLLESVRGPRGGYRLGRPRRDIYVSDIAAVASEPEAVEGPLDGLAAAVVQPLWAQYDAAIAERMRALSLEDLLRQAAAAGLRRPATDPISFAI